MMGSVGGACVVGSLILANCVDINPLPRTSLPLRLPVAVPKTSRLLLVWRTLFDLFLFYPGPIAQRPQHFVAAGHDGVAFLQPAKYLDVRDLGNAGFHGNKFGFV